MDLYLAWFVIWIFGTLVFGVLLSMMLEIGEFIVSLIASIAIQVFVLSVALILFILDWALKTVGFY